MLVDLFVCYLDSHGDTAGRLLMLLARLRFDGSSLPACIDRERDFEHLAQRLASIVRALPDDIARQRLVIATDSALDAAVRWC